MAIALDKIRTDGGTQTRASLSTEVIEDYAEAYRSGEKLPLLDVFQDEDGEIWLAAGFHRLAGARNAKLAKIECNVHKGTRRDAVLFSAASNATHGLRRSNEDKRYAVQVILLDPEWRECSDRWIAEQCKVSRRLVEDVRKNFTGGGSATCQESNNRKGKDGKTYRVPSAATPANGAKPPNTDAHGRPTDKKKRPKNVPDEVKDRVGEVVPRHLRDVFADTAFPDFVTSLEQIDAMFDPKNWTTKAGKLCTDHAFILIDKFKDHVYEAQSQLQLAVAALKAGLPHALCPKCKGMDSRKDGKTCRTCRGGGHIPEWKFEEVKS